MGGKAVRIPTEKLKAYRFHVFPAGKDSYYWHTAALNKKMAIRLCERHCRLEWFYKGILTHFECLGIAKEWLEPIEKDDIKVIKLIPYDCIVQQA